MLHRHWCVYAVLLGTLATLALRVSAQSFDATGKSVHTQYLVYKVLTQQGVSGWDSIEASWEPWHEERPVLRARVITPERAIHLLDRKTISDAAARDDDNDIYGDSRVVRAPLPAIAAGSIVEEEIVSKENAPFFWRRCCWAGLLRPPTTCSTRHSDPRRSRHPSAPILHRLDARPHPRGFCGMNPYLRISRPQLL